MVEKVAELDQLYILVAAYLLVFLFRLGLSSALSQNYLGEVSPGVPREYASGPCCFSPLEKSPHRTSPTSAINQASVLSTFEI